MNTYQTILVIYAVSGLLLGQAFTGFNFSSFSWKTWTLFLIISGPCIWFFCVLLGMIIGPAWLIEKTLKKTNENS